MKKYFLTAAALLLLSPLTASADLVGTTTMTMIVSPMTGPAGTFQNVQFPSDTTAQNYLVDYEADIGSASLSGYTFYSIDNAEVFCVEDANMYTKNVASYYSFYNTTDILSNAGKVTWIAENYFLGAIAKEVAQVAIWKTVIGGTYSGGYSSDADTFLATYNNTSQFINNYLVAVSPAVGSTDTNNYQNFLVKATAPVPEPGTMLLFGTGLAGLAAVSRRRRS